MGVSQLFYLTQKDADVGSPSYVMIVNRFDRALLEGRVNFNDVVGVKKEVADGVFVTKTKNFKLGNYSAFEFESEVKSGSQTDARPEIGVNIDLGQQVVGISMMLSNSKKEGRVLFEKILSTFKFQ
jgi:hypothetical protein